LAYLQDAVGDVEGSSNEILVLQPLSLVRTHFTILRHLFHYTFAEMGTFMHAVEDEMLCSSLISDRVPYFNAPIYLQNKSVIGKVDEILGPINEVYFSVKMGEGMVASSFKQGDKVYIGGDKLLPIERFLPKPKVPGMLFCGFSLDLLPRLISRCNKYVCLLLIKHRIHY
jgi:H/ACA ribonucleoprotein complex subunit 1